MQINAHLLRIYQTWSEDLEYPILICTSIHGQSFPLNTSDHMYTDLTVNLHAHIRHWELPISILRNSIMLSCNNHICIGLVYMPRMWYGILLQLYIILAHRRCGHIVYMPDYWKRNWELKLCGPWDPRVYYYLLIYPILYLMCKYVCRCYATVPVEVQKYGISYAY